MREEIFGPILPVLEVSSLEEAVDFVNERPAPLAAYLFSERPRNQRIFEDTVRAGAIGHNICNAHPMVPGLPFGGVGASGMGSYHGRSGFETFSHRKAAVFVEQGRGAQAAALTFAGSAPWTAAPAAS
jgi:aldehyde dehydrogenase (NAD+)